MNENDQLSCYRSGAFFHSSLRHMQGLRVWEEQGQVGIAELFEKYGRRYKEATQIAIDCYVVSEAFKEALVKLEGRKKWIKQRLAHHCVRERAFGMLLQVSRGQARCL